MGRGLTFFGAPTPLRHRPSQTDSREHKFKISAVIVGESRIAASDYINGRVVYKKGGTQWGDHRPIGIA